MPVLTITISVTTFKPITRLAVVEATVAVMLAGIFILPDLGRPERVLNLLLHPNITSPMIWDITIVVAYTNDWVEPENLSAAASQMVKLYGIGAVAGPFVAGGTMSAIGPTGFQWSLAAMHIAIAVFFGYRMVSWRSPLVKRPWNEVSLPARAFFVPATIIAIGRRRRR
mgnify:CR=1 FL=1